MPRCEMSIDEAEAAEAMRDRIAVYLRDRARRLRTGAAGSLCAWTNAVTLEQAADHVAEMRPAGAPTGLEVRGG
jgi:hypothetical protein